MKRFAIGLIVTFILGFVGYHFVELALPLVEHPGVLLQSFLGFVLLCMCLGVLGGIVGLIYVLGDIFFKDD